MSDPNPYPLSFLQRSAEFRLPDISLSSLEALLQTVTQKLGRKRGGGDGRPQRHFQSDHLLTVEHCLSERRVGQQTERCAEEGKLTKMYVFGGSEENLAKCFIFPQVQTGNVEYNISDDMIYSFFKTIICTFYNLFNCLVFKISLCCWH